MHFSFFDEQHYNLRCMHKFFKYVILTNFFFFIFLHRKYYRFHIVGYKIRGKKLQYREAPEPKILKSKILYIIFSFSFRMEWLWIEVHKIVDFSPWGNCATSLYLTILIFLADCIAYYFHRKGNTYYNALNVKLIYLITRCFYIMCVYIPFTFHKIITYDYTLLLRISVGKNVFVKFFSNFHLHTSAN